MKHNWIDNNSKDYNRILEDKMRKCINCGEEQVFVSTGTWMRIGQRRWEPLVGKCKGTKEINK